MDRIIRTFYDSDPPIGPLDDAPMVPAPSPPRVWRCGLCQKWWREGPMGNVSCCVQHSPGSCCHYMQDEVTDPADIPAVAPDLFKFWD